MQGGRTEGSFDLPAEKGGDMSELHSEKRDKAFQHLVEEVEAICRKHLARSNLLKTIDLISALSLVTEQLRVNLVADTLMRTLASVKIEV